MPRSVHLLCGVAALFALAVAGRAQCSAAYVPNSGLPTTAAADVRGATLWDPDGAGAQPPVLVVGGNFVLPAVGAQHIAVQDLGTGAWSALPGWTYGTVTALAVLANGDLVAAGSAGSGPGGTHVIARWDGVAWQQVAVANERVFALLGARNGDLYAGGAFTGIGNTLIVSLARFDGVAWAPLGGGIGAFSFVLALAELPDGSVVAGGSFSSAGGVATPGIARWDGSAWSALGTGFGGMVVDLAGAANGELFAGGGYTGGVSRWDGATWTALPGGPDPAAMLFVLPDGDLVAHGTFAGGVVATRRYAGGSWTPFAAGLATAIPAQTPALAGGLLLPDGDLAIHGSFATAAGAPSAGLVSLRSSCPASVAAAGNGCPSSGGANRLTATNLPWLGSTFTARGEGLPALALVSIVHGLAPLQLPLANVLPQGQPGCDLRVAPDLVHFVVTTTGAVTTTLAIPDAAALVGLDVYHQLNPFEVTPALGIVAVTASNALRLRLGAW